MEIEINWLAVVLATVIGMVTAGTWYTDWAFGKVWRQLTGVTEKDSQKAGNTPMILVLIANIITAVVLAAAISISAAFFESSSVWLALLVGFAMWLAFSATTLITHNAFERKPAKLTAINNGFQLVLFLSMALVIGVVGA